MNLDSVKTGLNKKFGRTGLVLQKRSPEILLGLGIVGGIAAAIMAARATLKLNDLLIEVEEERATIELAIEEGKTPAGTKYSQVDYQRSLGVHYVQTGLKFAKLYGPSFGIGVLSITSILASHGVMANRQVALVGAYNLLNEGFKSYRQRVIEELGEEKDRQFNLGLREETYSIKELGEDGKKVTVKKKTLVSDRNAPSIYSRFFDSSNPMFRSDRLLNRAFLTAQQNYINDLLIIRGHVFLNEVYERLGFEHTREGAIVGWVLRSPEQMKEENRDGYVSFGLEDPITEADREFMNLSNDAVLLDFNVDGIVYNLI